ncbi:helix-turn-helix domain-containing protein [Yinghuangia sp. YIM S09857]|uniref:helix-turn-helix domain-containing protein n=1 Tax=Yinghuangia sp. YIM S09857 TaxID=3436929 RepID=UPI003F52EF7B
MDAPKPRLARKRLGETFRELRKARPWTLGEAARRVKLTDSKLSRIENAESGISRDDLNLLCALYDVDDDQRAELLGLFNESKARTWWTYAPFSNFLTGNYQALIGYEAECSHEKEYQPVVWPGLLQIPEYARAVISAGPLVQDEEAIETLVEARTRRQDALNREDFALTAVVTLSAITYRHGGTDVLRAQLEHVLHMMERPNVRVHLIPEDVSAGGFAGGVTLLRFEPAADLSIAYLDSVVDTEETDNPRVIGWINRLFTHFETIALDPHATRAVITKRVESLQNA